MTILNQLHYQTFQNQQLQQISKIQQPQQRLRQYLRLQQQPQQRLRQYLRTTSTTTTTVPDITNIIVTVSNDGSGSEYYLNGSKGSTINVSNGTKYRFDQSDSSNSGHPLRISTFQEGSQYSMNVIIYGTPGSSGAYTEIEITAQTPSTLYIYCLNHFGMGANNVLLKS